MVGIEAALAGCRDLRENKTMWNPKDRETLEKLIDAHGLMEVIEALAVIAGEKAEHVRVNWQDSSLAESWHRDAAHLEKVALRLEN